MKSYSPEQELYDAVYANLQSLAQGNPGFSVYTHSPSADAPYPFVKLGPVQIVPVATKTALLASIYLDINVWGSKENRGKVSTIAINILRGLSKIKRTSSFAIEMNMARSSYLVRPDQSTQDDLWVAEVTTEWSLR